MSEVEIGPKNNNFEVDMPLNESQVTPPKAETTVSFSKFPIPHEEI